MNEPTYRVYTFILKTRSYGQTVNVYSQEKDTLTLLVHLLYFVQWCVIVRLCAIFKWIKKSTNVWEYDKAQLPYFLKYPVTNYCHCLDSFEVNFYFSPWKYYILYYSIIFLAVPEKQSGLILDLDGYIMEQSFKLHQQKWSNNNNYMQVDIDKLNSSSCIQHVHDTGFVLLSHCTDSLLYDSAPLLYIM